MTMPITASEAEAFLYHEARCLDERDWDVWLDLYVESCMFWMPAWRDETEVTTDPEAELSLIYYRGRQNLVDRVWRARSGQSIASRPLPRTVHMIGNVQVDAADADTAQLSSCFTVHLNDTRAQRIHVFFGRYTHGLQRQDDAWRIASKKIVLLNDVIPTVVDFYAI